jgi:hypothetical protein
VAGWDKTRKNKGETPRGWKREYTYFSPDEIMLIYPPGRLPLAKEGVKRK